MTVHSAARTPLPRPSRPATPAGPDALRAELERLFPPLPWLHAEGIIGVGGMGTVLRGSDLDLRREVAIKVLDERLRDSPEAALRFITEAQIGGQLQHPGIVPIYHFDWTPDDRPFFAMKLVTGRDLGALLNDRSHPEENLDGFLQIFRDVCRTLAYAHRHGVIHRDLKPSNVMVGDHGEVQVMDWGLAKVLGDPSSGTSDIPTLRTERTEAQDSALQSRAGDAIGTPAYMPPEQARGQARLLDRRADVFGLGAILCEILTGRPPFEPTREETSLQRAARGDLNDAFLRLDLSAAGPDLVHLAKACLDPDPDARPQDARAVEDVFTAYLESVGERLRASEMARAEAQAVAHQERRYRRLLLALMMTVGGLVVLVGSGWAWVDGQRRILRAQGGQHVRALIDHARHLEVRAREAGDMNMWNQAVESASRAVTQAQEGETDASMRKWVDSQYSSLKSAKERAEKVDQARARDDLVRMQLETLRQRAAALRPGDDTALIAAAYRAMLIDLKLDVLGNDPEVTSGALRVENAAPELIVGLDVWAGLSDPTRAARLEKVARLAEASEPGDPRARFHDALARRDRLELEALASDPTLTDDPDFVPRLASALRRVGAAEKALALLEQAWNAAPSNYWINQELSLALCRLDEPRYADALIYAQGAVVLRPRDPWPRRHRALILAELGRLDEARAEFHVIAPSLQEYPGALDALRDAVSAPNRP